MKKCLKCNSVKNLSEFYKTRGGSDRPSNECKDCAKERGRLHRLAHIKEYSERDKKRQRFNIKRILDHRYAQMKRRATTKSDREYGAYGKPLLTREEYTAWTQENKELFDKIYNIWAENDFIKSLSPSIDRIDNGVGYIPSNMQWLPFNENAAKGDK